MREYVPDIETERRNKGGWRERGHRCIFKGCLLQYGSHVPLNPSILMDYCHLLHEVRFEFMFKNKRLADNLALPPTEQRAKAAYILAYIALPNAPQQVCTTVLVRKFVMLPNTDTDFVWLTPLVHAL